MMFSERFGRSICLTVAASVIAIPLATRAGDATSPQRQAFTLGVDASVKLLDRDVEDLSDILERRAGYDVRRIDRGAVTRECFERDFRAWGNAAHKSATKSLLVYYRGAVVVDSDGAVHLVLDRTDASRTDEQISLTFVIDELSGCLQEGKSSQVETAAILLDLAQDESPELIRAGIQKALAKCPAMAKPAISVLAMVLPKRESVWDAVNQSRAGYWLGRALRGEAESDRNGSVTTKEVVDYVSHQMRVASPQQRVFCVSNVGSQTTLANTRPLKLEEVIEDVADSVAAQLHERGASIVAVPDFTAVGQPTEDEDLPGQAYGPLLRTSQAVFKKELSKRSNQQFKLVEQQWLREALNKHAITPANIDTPQRKEALERLKEELEAQWLDDLTLIIGSMEHRGGLLQVQCTPWNATEAAYLSQGRATLTSSDWGMIGKSAVNERAMKTVQQPAVTEVATVPVSKRHEPKPYELLDFRNKEDVERVVDEIQRLEQDAKQVHPLLREDFPIDVAVKVGGRVIRQVASVDRRHVYCTLSPGDRYTIKIANNSGQSIFMRLLVDGLNTLPDRPLLESDGVGKYEVAVKDSGSQFLPAQYASLTNARAWHCGPGEWEIPGFFTAVGNSRDGKRAEAESAAFVVTDASRSEAWRNGYPKDVGVITAAFYTPMTQPLTMAPTKRFGTMLGVRQKQNVNVYAGKQVPGELLAVVHLRYGVTE